MDDLLLEIPNKVNLAALRESAETACRTLQLAEKHDLSFDDEYNVSLPPPANVGGTEEVPVPRATTSLLEVYNMIREYGGPLHATAEEVRNTIINKLLLETENTDGRIRIKALELLGKVPEIGLFVDPKDRDRSKNPDQAEADKLKARLKDQLTDLKKDVEGVYEPQDGDTKA